jgi:NAD(P)-dependent dehydrogenase (short-subunit alcohol dehydrogenase family)
MTRIAVVTGTSTGIGLATSLELARRGYRVFAGLRNPAKAGPLREGAAKEDLPVEVIQLDVTSPDSVARAFEAVRKHGSVDVLVNNAGIGGATPLEFVPEDEHRQIFETNYFGTVRCIQAVLPEMRERGAGTIANISSMTGRIATPNQIPYSASKFAIECLSEALAVEVCRFGIRVVIVEPGVVMTSIFENAKEATRWDKHSPYKQIMRRNGKVYAAGFRRAVQPQLVAETILQAITSPEYKLRWPVGDDAVGYAAGRPKVSDEDYIALGGDLDDAEYNGRYRRYFGIDL